jgi:hypothetical protein
VAKSKARKPPRKRTPKKSRTTDFDLSKIFRIKPPDISVDDERKRPRLLAILFCDFINTTGDEKPNLLGVFDNITVDRTVKTTPHFFVFIRVAEITDSFQTTVFNGDNQPVLQFRSFVRVKEGQFAPDLPRQMQTILRLQISQIEKEGVYWFDVSHQGNSLGGAGLPINYKPEGSKGSGTGTFI